MSIELTVGVFAGKTSATTEDKRIVTFASAESLLRELDTEDSSLRRQINRSYPKLAQVCTVATRLLGGAEAAWHWLNAKNPALEGHRTPLEELALDSRAYQVEELLENMAKETGPIEGVCFFWSETGTEDGYWAFHDTRFTVRSFAKTCRKCHLYWADAGEEPPVPSDPEYCPPGQHVWIPINEDEVEWLYGGLHVLENGDWLTIFSKDYPYKVLWKGEIHLKHYGAFKEDAFGFWIHDDQLGIDRKTWAKYFMKQYPARLETAKQRRAGDTQSKGRTL